MPGGIWWSGVVTAAIGPQVQPAAAAGGDTYEDTVLSYSPILYARMGDASGSLADISGNALDLSTDGTVAYGQAGWAGDGSGAVAWAGSGDYAYHVDDAAFDIGTSDFSIIVCLKRNGTPGSEETIIGRDGNGNAGEWGFFLSTAATLVVVRLDGSTFNLFHSADASIYDDTFHHLVLTFDRDANATLYFDGSSVGSVAISSKSAAALDNALTLWVGARGASSQNLNGALCELAVIPSLLSSGDVADIYAARNGTGGGGGSPPPVTSTYEDAVLSLSPVAYYKMDEGAGTTMTDASPTANDGSYQGSPTLGVAGPFAGVTGVTFNGTSQWATAPYHSALDFGAAEDYTIALWVKMAAWPSNEQWLIGRSGDGYANDYELKLHTNDVLRGRYPPSDTEVASGSSVDLDDGTWHFVVRSSDRDGNAVYYIDNTVSSTVDISSYTGALDRATALLIARRVTAGYFAGSIAQVAIFDSALTAGDVDDLWTAAGN